MYLIGAGPGAADLITLRGLRCLRAAEVVIYDHLVAPELLDECRSNAVRLYAGKEPGHHLRSQEEINHLLIAYARAGYIVARLKGGDPFVFGRGGEEALALAEAAIPFEVVPGVTSAVAVPAYAGIPVTQRGLACAFTVVTGHHCDSDELDALNWEQLAACAAPGGTLVVLMGVATLPAFTARLAAAGLDAQTPAAVIQQGTLPAQRAVFGTVATIARRAAEAGIRAPAITVIGSVVSLAETLAWFQTQPITQVAHVR